MISSVNYFRISWGIAVSNPLLLYPVFYAATAGVDCRWYYWIAYWTALAIITWTAEDGIMLAWVGWPAPGWVTPGWVAPGWVTPAWGTAGWLTAGWATPGCINPGWVTPGWTNPGWATPGWVTPGWANPGWTIPG